MQYQGVLLLLILLLSSHLTEESGYSCSDFHNQAGKPLEECPPAKFMLKDNLVECYDYTTKWSETRSTYQPQSKYPVLY